MNGNIAQLNENHNLNTRALAYVTNNPGTSFVDAVNAIVREDAAKARRVSRIRETNAAGRGSR